jgi:type I restriction enzyme M protein
MPENTTQAIDQDSINRIIWQACDTVRGTVAPSIYKDYVLTMLFLKYISDVWQDHYDGYQLSHGDKPELIEELLRNERFVLPHAANFHTLYRNRWEPGNGIRIDQALRALTESNNEKLHAVFRDIQFNSTKLGSDRQKNDILCHLLCDFAKPELDLRPSRVGNLDVIGNAYEFLIKNFASTSGKNAGEFYTPPEVSQLMALLLDPQDGDQICDPACGSGSLLMKCARLIRQRTRSPSYTLYGQEAIGSTWALAKMNMFLHGEDNHHIVWGDTLREPKLLDRHGALMQFDVVIANPPFSLEKWGHEAAMQDTHERFARGMPPPSRADYAFIQHMIASMKDDSGRMAVVVPLGVLFRGHAEGLIRKKLIDDNLLDAIIGLPEKLFYGTGIAAAILVFRRKKADNNVLVIDARHHYQDGKKQNLLRQDDIKRIADAYRARTGIAQYAHLASPAELLENDFNLSISRYVRPPVNDPVPDIVTLQRQRDELKRKIAMLSLKMDAQLAELGIIIDDDDGIYKDEQIERTNWLVH